MAIRDGESDSRPAPPRPKAAARPGLYVRTLIPRGAVSHSVSCCLIPPHALSRSRGSPASLPVCRQLVVVSGPDLSLYTIDASTCALRLLSRVTLFTDIRHIRAMPSPVPGKDIIVLLSERSRVSFMQYDESTARLRLSGEVAVLQDAKPAHKEARLLATHPRKWIIAVASLESTICVFRVLFLPKAVNAGKIASVTVDGVILAMDFLEDEVGLPGESILLVLFQRGVEQSIAIFTVGVPPDSPGGGGLLVTHIGSMITCSSNPSSSAIARHAASLGNELPPSPPAVGLSRLPGCPFLVAMFFYGKVVVADTRPIIFGAQSSIDNAPMAVRSCSDHYSSRTSSHVSSTPSSASPRVQSLSHNTGFSFFPSSTNRSRNSPPTGLATALGNERRGDNFSSCLFVPLHVTLELGDTDGAPTVWCNSCNHFRTHDGDTDGDGLYIVSESGAMHVLRWSAAPRLNVRSYVIPGEERTRAGPRRNFSLEYAGDVGPAVSLSSLDKNLLYIANDGADGSLRKVQHSEGPNGTLFTGWLSRDKRPTLSFYNVTTSTPVGQYSLEVRQEFPNLSPVSDFIVSPLNSVDVQKPMLYSSSSSPRTQQRQPRVDRRGSKRGRVSLSRDEKCDVYCTERESAGGIERPRSEASSGSGRPRVRHRDVGDSERRGRKDSARSCVDDDFESWSVERFTAGRTREPELIMCCGLQQHGSLRIVRPGAPVSLLSSSARSFQGCNNIWSLRFAAGAKYDSMIALSFTQSTRVMFSVPASAVNEDGNNGKSRPDVVSHLVDATSVSRIASDTHSLAVGLLEDGLIAQAHSAGVRTILMSKKNELHEPLQVENGQLLGPLAKRHWDWNVNNGDIVSAAAIGVKFLFLSIVRPGNISPCLLVLRQHSTAENGGLSIAYRLELRHELSCITVPEWPLHGTEYDSEEEFFGRCSSVVVIGTYSPSIEVWLLGPDAKMECIASASIVPLLARSPADILPGKFRSSSSSVGQSGRGPPQRSLEASGSQQNSRSDEFVHAALLTDLSASVSSGSANRSRSDSRGQFNAGSVEDHWSLQKRIRSSLMTGVPDSICAFESQGKQRVFVGLRNGTILRYNFGESDDDMLHSTSQRGKKLHLIARQKVGDRPISLKRVLVSTGPAVIAQAERPWIGSIDSPDFQWIPLSFPETRAWCAYSTPGAERCMATVASDNAIHICGVRQLTPVSVRSILIRATPRRVLALESPSDSLLVATCREQKIIGNENLSTSSGPDQGRKTASKPSSELRVYNKFSGRLLGRTSLADGELVHVMLKWLDFIVVGTSRDIRFAKKSGSTNNTSKGRLLLFAVSGKRASVEKSTVDQRPRKCVPIQSQFELCGEVAHRGAFLAGAVHSNQEMLVVSSNEVVFVFGMPKSRSALVEVARISTRMLVLSIAIWGQVICVADRKDSVAFFRLDKGAGGGQGGLVRDRTDHRERIVADVAMVDSRTAVATDKYGGLFSLGYEDGDGPPPSDGAYLSVSSLMPEGLLADANLDASGRTSPETSYGEASNLGNSELGEIHKENGSDGTHSNADISDTLAGSHESPPLDDSQGAGDSQGHSGDPSDDMYDEVETEDPEDSLLATVDTAEGAEEDTENSMDDEDDAGEGGGNPVQGANVQNLQQDLAAAGEGIGAGNGGVLQVGFGNNMNDGPEGAAAFAILQSQPRRDFKVPVQRNLVCNHSFNMRDTAMRVRYGTFRRLEALGASNTDSLDTKTDRGLLPGSMVEASLFHSFWSDTSKSILAGTLEGAVISAIPISAPTVTLLNEIVYALSSHTAIASQALGSNYQRFRAAYGSRSEGVVDGDLLQQFLNLDTKTQQEIVAAAGCVGDDSVQQVESLIHELCNRVG